MADQEPMRTEMRRLSLDDLALVEVNARHMTSDTFKRLVENVRQDGSLTSVPFAVREEDGKYRVLSGNHRVMAARDAGMKEIWVLVTDDPLSSDRRIAIQLSHNAIVGEDDPSVLAYLYEQIEGVDARLYSGVDDPQDWPGLELPGFGSPDPELLATVLLFTEAERDTVRGALEAAADLAPHASEVWLAPLSLWDRTLSALDLGRTAGRVWRTGLGLAVVLEVFEAHRHDLAGMMWQTIEGQGHPQDVPIAMILGVDRLPPDTARKLDEVASKAVDSGELPNAERWRVLERLWD